MKIFFKTIFIGMVLCWGSTNAQTVTKQLYLSNPGQALDRVHPGLVSPIDVTTASSAELGTIDGRAAQAFGTPTDISNQFGANSLTPDLAVFESGGTETVHTVFLSQAPTAAKLNIYHSSKTGAGSWTTPVLISDDGFNQNALSYPSIVVDVNGDVHVVYAHKNTDNTGLPIDAKINIYYVTNASGSWSTPLRISNDAFGNDANSPELALDTGGKVHVAYMHKNATDAKKNIYYVTNTSGSWSSPARISDDTFNQDVGLNPAIAIDGSDKAHVAYNHKDGAVDAKKNIYYVTNASGSWSSAARISDDGFNQDALPNPSIAIDSNDKPHVVYTHKDGAVDAKLNIYYTEKTGGSWSSPLDLTNDKDGSDSSNPDLAISSDGVVRVAYANNGANIYYTENSGAGKTWITAVDINPTTPTKSSDGDNPAVFVTENNVHAVYSDKHVTLSGDIDVWHISAPLEPHASTAFTQSPVLCSNIVMSLNGTVNVTLHTNTTGGTMPVSPDVTATLSSTLGSTFMTLSNPTYTPGTGSAGTLTWTGTLGTATTLVAGDAMVLTVSSTLITATFTIQYDSNTKPSKIEFPTTTYINVDALNVYDAAYPAGSIIADTALGATVYVRAIISDPFGFADITGTDITRTPPGSSSAATSVATSGCTRTYEYPWTTTSGGTIDVQATAKEGFENTVTDVDNISFLVSSPPTANDDVGLTPEDTPVDIDVINNDTDPDNDIDSSSVAIVSPPPNGSTSINPVTGVIIYTPDLNFVGNDQFSYQVCDTYGACDTAVVDVNVPEVNDDPTAIDDAFTVAYNTANQILDVLDAGTPDYDVEGHVITLAGVGTDAADGLTNQGGTVTINNNGTPGDPTDDYVEYTPANGFVGYDAFQYEITDVFGGSGIGTVTLTVLANIEINCSNGFDDDADGLIDCADPDCTPVRPVNFFRKS